MHEPKYESLGCAPEERDQAALYVLGELAKPDEAAFAAHLEGCESCRLLVSELQRVVHALALAGPEVEPPAHLRQRVLDRVRDDASLDREQGRRWLETGTPGVRLAQLSLDRERERHTLLLRMEAGSTLPAHHHHAAEECFVVEGDLVDGDLVLHAGDYVRNDPGSIHGPSTRGGCLLFVSASIRDRRVET